MNGIRVLSSEKRLTAKTAKTPLTITIGSNLYGMASSSVIKRITINTRAICSAGERNRQL
jgi:hypothetical protein